MKNLEEYFEELQRMAARDREVSHGRDRKKEDSEREDSKEPSSAPSEDPTKLEDNSGGA